MHNDFKEHIAKTFDFDPESPLLLACSGGCDSVVLGHLLHQSGFRFVVVHMNFQLRGQDSDQDALFVASLAQQWSAPYYVKRVDVPKYIEDHGCSVQMAARELRYTYFEAIRVELNLQAIVVAHHADDDHETFLLNLSRGTGLSGLSGMANQNGFICRPLLPFSRETIEGWAQDHDIVWRQDRSNDSDYYERNFIRHHVANGLKQMKRPWLKAFRTTTQNLQQAETLLRDYLTLVTGDVLTKSDQGAVIDLERLNEHPHAKSLLTAVLKPYGFTAWKDLPDLIEAESGKYIDTPTHRIQKDRKTLIMIPHKVQESTKESILIQKGQNSVDGPVTLRINLVSQWEKPLSNEIYVDASLVSFPLCLRPWKSDDIFHPFGLEGKKQLGKYFKDEKLSLASKNKIWVLESNGAIIWVVGYRLDDRFKITGQTTDIMHFATL